MTTKDFKYHEDPFRSRMAKIDDAKRDKQALETHAETLVEIMRDLHGRQEEGLESQVALLIRGMTTRIKIIDNDIHEMYKSRIISPGRQMKARKKSVLDRAMKMVR